MSFDSDYEPWFQPPGWIVGPIWLILYSMIVISFMMVLSRKEKISNSNIIITLFLIQLLVNLMWPNVFNSGEYLTSFLMIVIMVVFRVAKLMDSTTTVTLLHIRQYGYLP
jgi:tryptophan-rich sensory protein